MISQDAHKPAAHAVKAAGIEDEAGLVGRVLPAVAEDQ